MLRLAGQFRPTCSRLWLLVSVHLSAGLGCNFLEDFTHVWCLRKDGQKTGLLWADIARISLSGPLARRLHGLEGALRVPRQNFAREQR